MIDSINWTKTPLIPVITQDNASLQVLMLAYVNSEALDLSLKSGVAHYFSRSKNRIWKKGEESGNIQILKEVYIDCDNDAILFKVEQNGMACHTGNVSCFYKKLDFDGNIDLSKSQNIDLPYSTIDKLYHILQDRKTKSKDTSYTASLYAKGENTIGKKIVEEASEFAFAIKDNKNDEIIYECADLIYHTLVGLSYKDISPDRVMQELNKRFAQSGLEEKAQRKG
ncbi:bifunctional phosphoribosyl-AMP cyclohydrolase/phosphoribosyl-ATP diphosphatase HisIE [Helicobacter sp. MIT 99-5507]|uniref:bifunctional phosphoribosyl-AMP cyclohydrolase/phosphoribosyl-ATP diphosphatase HisIE n=1 Tax=Helicobacter sp. MIT 99-5507 TaxID=152489 RepID=UPI000E1F198E|nr:bifunctional phosphoribosyl-AMP cyclohydrolase/phosphoribosyl-ATP diphosphatase HisIE [Helicobacter sp. MIT 99-5507]RDU58094.1 bifunctional phosphoribosyl-AMP cyclohydrolase/phosphoribosyl-ATP pyrophosphatase [Helicobacter sp. MIT 99-5507]